jgi:Fe-S-cluster containining protein
MLFQIQSADRRLLDEIGAAMAEAARRGPHWIACRPGCTECCKGPFAISQLDAMRLREGLAVLAATDPARAQAVQSRAAAYVTAAAAVYPGDPSTGELFDEHALPDSMDELPCPALDSETGLCDLYDARPITCRTFGPATRLGDESIAACELCYVGATPEEISRCAVEPDPASLESQLLDSLESAGHTGFTIVAHVLAGTVHRTRNSH